MSSGWPMLSENHSILSDKWHSSLISCYLKNDRTAKNERIFRNFKKRVSFQFCSLMETGRRKKMKWNERLKENFVAATKRYKHDRNNWLAPQLGTPACHPSSTPVCMRKLLQLLLHCYCLLFLTHILTILINANMI